MGSEKKVRYAVVGAGWISQAAFMPGVAATGNSVMTAIVTGDSTKAEQLGQLYGIDRAYHYDAYLAALDSHGFDAIYLALPNWQHRQTPSRRWSAASTSCSRSRWRPPRRIVAPSTRRRGAAGPS